MFGRQYRSYDEMNYTTWFTESTNELKWCWWPRRCYETNQFIWLEPAYRSRRYFRSGDNFITEDRWFSREEFLILMLKSDVR